MVINSIRKSVVPSFEPRAAGLKVHTLPPCYATHFNSFDLHWFVFFIRTSEKFGLFSDPEIFTSDKSRLVEIRTENFRRESSV